MSAPTPHLHLVESRDHKPAPLPSQNILMILEKSQHVGVFAKAINRLHGLNLPITRFMGAASVGPYLLFALAGHLDEQQKPKQIDPDRFANRGLEPLPLLPGSGLPICVRPDDPENRRGKKGRTYEKIFEDLVEVGKNTQRPIGMIYFACDAEREGIGIARRAIKLAAAAKDGAKLLGEVPHRTIYPHSENIDGFATALARPLEDSDPIPNDTTGATVLGLYRAFEARRNYDFCFGMNFSDGLRFTFNRRRPTHAGRVISVIEQMIYERCEAIRSFVPRTFYGFEGTFQDADGNCFKLPYETPKNDRIWDEAQAKATADSLIGKRANAHADKKRVVRKPPDQFNIDGLQAAMADVAKWSLEKTLIVADGLRTDPKGFLTYIRTDSVRFAVSDQQLIPTVLANAALDPELVPFIPDQSQLNIGDHMFSNAPGAIGAHGAIGPTTDPYIGAGIDLTEDELLLLRTVYKRYLAGLTGNLVEEETSLSVTVEAREFKLNAISILEPGWTRVLGSKKHKLVEIPPIKHGTLLTVTRCEVTQGTTTAPDYYTEKTLVAALTDIGKNIQDPVKARLLKDKGGVGRPSTKTNAITSLIKRRRVVLEGQNIVDTPEMRRECQQERTYFPEIGDAINTAIMEEKCDRIARGEMTVQDFFDEISEEITGIVARMKKLHFDQPTLGMTVWTHKLTKVTYSAPVKDTLRSMGCEYRPGIGYIVPEGAPMARLDRYKPVPLTPQELEAIHLRAAA